MEQQQQQEEKEEEGGVPSQEAGKGGGGRAEAAEEALSWLTKAGYGEKQREKRGEIEKKNEKVWMYSGQSLDGTLGFAQEVPDFKKGEKRRAKIETTEKREQILDDILCYAHELRDY